ncbi:MAG: GNAT family N-acetyltransferase [Actinomycetota bacterium]
MSEFDVVHVGERSGLRYSRIRPEWAAELAALELASYPTADPNDLYDEPSLLLLARDFPEGCFAGFDGDSLVAMGLGVRCHFDLDRPQHTIGDIVPEDHASSGHVPDGPWYYGTGISTRPEYRRRGIGTELYGLRKEVCRTLDLRGIVAGGVIPGYADHKHEMSADDYIAEVRAGRLYDRTLSFQLENGFEAPCALADYIEDPAVDSYAALIVWHNDGRS